MEKFDKIYVLGSGFSKSISMGMPAMGELTSKLFTESDEEKYKYLIAFINYLKSITNEKKEMLNIESISSLVLGRKIFYNSSHSIINEVLKNQLLHWLYDKIDENAHQVDKDKIAPLSNFINKCVLGDKNGKKSLVLTFNYDLLIERLIQNQLHDLELSYLIKFNRYFDYDDCINHREKPNFHYLKLHGSFNWFRTPGSIETNINNVFLVNDNDDSRELIHHDDIPIFIPMAYAKGIFLDGSFYNTLWNMANSYLAKADEINFIGYGFPSTDIDNLFFFLNYRNKIKKVVVSETQSSKTKRLIDIFGQDKIINMDASEYMGNIS